MMTAYYLLQEIASSKPQIILVKITSGDALVVFLNGKQQFIQNNPFKKDSMMHKIMLTLKQEKNQLVIKLFNNFEKQIPFAIDYNVPQLFYKQSLSPASLRSKSYFPVSWQLHQPLTPHEDMGAPNMMLQFKAAP